MKNKIKNVFIDGPILPSKIAESIQKHRSRKISEGTAYFRSSKSGCYKWAKSKCDRLLSSNKIANQICYEIQKKLLKNTILLVCTFIIV